MATSRCAARRFVGPVPMETKRWVRAPLGRRLVSVRLRMRSVAPAARVARPGGRGRARSVVGGGRRLRASAGRQALLLGRLGAGLLRLLGPRAGGMALERREAP